MPTYEYACKQCGQNFEIFQSFSDKPLKKHEECGGDLQKVFHARGIVFKGSGFYQTDYRSESYKKSAEAEKKAGAGSLEERDQDQGQLFQRVLASHE